jgi:hypothetical protein
MVKEFLNNLKIKVSDEDYNIILEMAIDDIRFNRTSFNKETSPEMFIEICKRCWSVLNKCNGGVMA